MLDIKFIRENTEAVIENNKARGIEVDVHGLLDLDDQRVSLQNEIDNLRAERNRASKTKPSAGEIAQMRKVGERIAKLEEQLRSIESREEELLHQFPNRTHPDVPHGKDESENKVVRVVGEMPHFAFKPKEHWELGEKLGVLDMKSAANVTGSRFAYIKGGLALLEFALIQHTFNVLTNEQALKQIVEKNNLSVPSTSFIPVLPPVMIRPDVFHKMARLEPKEERYYIPGDDLYLIGSAEHTLGPLHMETILKAEELPIRYIGFSTAFRREAGSYGKDMKGIFRVHQFDKLEMESFSLPEQSEAEQDFLIAIQEYLMQSLQLPYRVVLKCTGDMGAPDYREYDIEAWLPGQNKYRETHTADLMTDFQSRRLNIRVKQGDKTRFVHMNDATAIALSRTPIAIMENYQQEDGSIIVPEVLRKYMGFEVIRN